MCVWVRWQNGWLCVWAGGWLVIVGWVVSYCWWWWVCFPEENAARTYVRTHTFCALHRREAHRHHPAEALRLARAVPIPLPTPPSRLPHKDFSGPRNSRSDDAGIVPNHTKIGGRGQCLPSSSLHAKNCNFAANCQRLPSQEVQLESYQRALAWRNAVSSEKGLTKNEYCIIEHPDATKACRFLVVKVCSEAMPARLAPPIPLASCTLICMPTMDYRACTFPPFHHFTYRHFQL